MEPTTISVGATKHREFGTPRQFKVSCGAMNGYGPTLAEAKEQLTATLVNAAQASRVRPLVLTNEAGDMVIITTIGNAQGNTFQVEHFRRSDMSEDSFVHLVPSEDDLREIDYERSGTARWNPSSITIGGEKFSDAVRWAQQWLKREGA